MALALLEGFEDQSILSAGGGSADPGRTGGTCLCVRAGGGGSATLTIPTAFQSPTLLLGCAIKPGVNGSTSVMEFKGDGGTLTHNTLALQSSAAAYLEFYRGGALLGNTGAASLVWNAWQYMEILMVLHDTLGSVDIRLNGVPKLTLTNIDTRNGGTNLAYDTIVFLGSSTGYLAIDDLYLQTGTVTRYGDIVVETLYPNGNGAANTWVGSDGNSTDNYLLVNETGTPVTTSYSQSSTSGNKDLYTLNNLVAPAGTVFGVCHAAFMGTDAGTGSVNIVNRTTTTDVASSALSLNTTYKTVLSSYETDPDGGAWDIAKVNGMQVGVQVT